MDVRALLASLSIEVAEDDGREILARCPSGVHADKNPSWIIHSGGSKEGIHVCRSCGYSGDAIDLVRRVLDVGFVVARDWVLEHGKEPERKPPAKVTLELIPPKVGKDFALPPGAEFPKVWRWAAPARAYATSRGITSEQIERWGIGYAIEGRLRGRLVFPIRDDVDRLRSWVARSFCGQPIRYLTPKKEDGADPSAVFGEERWRERRVVVVCEGAINALAAERAGAAEVAALGGSRLEPGVVAKLSRFRGMIILTDSDLAGEKARGELAGAVGRSVRVANARLDPGTDAAKEDPAVLRSMLAEAEADLW
jgi:DNA primase